MQKHEKKREKGVPFLAFFRFFSFLFLFFFADKRKSLIFATKSRNLLCPSTNAKTDNMKLSVIVPVYNVEKFLPRCLDSLLRQGLEVGEYEVICVNDGSPDGSAAILAEYERKHPEVFKVITQENRGLGGARNSGMKVARGEWITFVDSDDYIIDKGYRYILDHFCADGVEVVHFLPLLVYTDGKSLHDPDAKPDGEISFDGDGVEVYNQDSLSYVWTKFIRRTFLTANDIWFEYAFMEDEPFNFDVFSRSPRLRIVTCKIYRYEQGNSNSLLTMVDKKKVLGQMDVLLQIVEKMNNYLQQGEGRLAPAARRCIDNYLRTFYNKMLKADLDRQEWQDCVKSLRALPIQKVDLDREASRLGKVIAFLKNGAATSYPAYRSTAWLMNVVFRQLVRPRIIASYAK